MLGHLHAELDMDVEAIMCLKRSYEVDPYSLDNLLALGVSCTNELDRTSALKYLRTWIQNHEVHNEMVINRAPPPDGAVDLWCREVTHLFEMAAEATPLDADVFVALGVLQNINRNFPAAVSALSTACRLRPNDHTNWNKLGATLANSGKSEKAVIAYHQGLQLKPNYARSWSNLAIAHNNLNQLEDTARFYLSSVSLNPNAEHVWGLLNQTMARTQNQPGREACQRRDLAALHAMIPGAITADTLPPRAEILSQSPEEVLMSMGILE